MKGILEFNLPEDKEDFQLAQKAINYSIAIDDFDNYLRAELKYNEHSYTLKERALLTFIRDRFNKICREAGAYE